MSSFRAHSKHSLLFTTSPKMNTIKTNTIDGVYTLDTNTNKEAFMKEIGLPDADIKMLINPKNVHTWTIMENKDHSFTIGTFNTVAPHLNINVTLKLGEIKKVMKPFPMTLQWDMKTTMEHEMKIVFNGKQVLCKLFFHNYGFTMTTVVEGCQTRMEASFLKNSPTLDGFFELVTEENLFEFLQKAIPTYTAEMYEKMKTTGFARRVRDFCLEDGTKCLKIEYGFGDMKYTTVYKEDEAVEFIHKVLGCQETRLLTKIGPGHYKIVCKNRKTGKMCEMEMAFDKFGMHETLTCEGLMATAHFRRGTDLEGVWRSVIMENTRGFLETLGVHEPMKTEMLATKDWHHEFLRLTCDQICLKATTRFFPGGFMMRRGEQWQLDLTATGLGHVRGITTELNNTLLHCIKVNEKNIAVKQKVSGDFMIYECDVDGDLASRMKMIMVLEHDLNQDITLNHFVHH